MQIIAGGNCGRAARSAESARITPRKWTHRYGSAWLVIRLAAEDVSGWAAVPRKPVSPIFSSAGPRRLAGIVGGHARPRPLRAHVLPRKLVFRLPCQADGARIRSSAAS